MDDQTGAKGEQWVTLTEAAGALGIPRRTVASRAERGQVPARHDTLGRWLIDLSRFHPPRGVPEPADEVAWYREQLRLANEHLKAGAEREAALLDIIRRLQRQG